MKIYQFNLIKCLYVFKKYFREMLINVLKGVF